ncbi:MAG: 16S rRNA (adenine(1518)-N(6)/adenine(1519)-N(6))-dimethyltransferase, partial [Pseudomonadales bacterium]|nr:16S rRNA (adenine(1518)-N(6)/adenine(1519)-N(6))-dimethyltransferase [Pseudomonadales bacterium]
SVPSSAFSPRPAVESAILRIAPYATPPCKAIDEALLSRLVTAAFAQRRKTLRNTLKAFCSAEQLEALAIAPGSRAETLPVADFVKIANAVQVSQQ